MDPKSILGEAWMSIEEKVDFLFSVIWSQIYKIYPLTTLLTLKQLTLKLYHLIYFRHMTQTTAISDLDRFKLEKKRERNRIAASKCRQRKLERISDLGNGDCKNFSEI